MIETKRIDGRAIATGLLSDLAIEVAALVQGGCHPGLAVVLVGDNPASQVYVRNKARETAAAGMRSFEHRLPANTEQAVLLELVLRLNADPAVHGILVQLPLPDQIDADAVLSAIDPDKDVDGFHVVNAGRLAVGLPGLVPCTPLGCAYLLRETLGDLSGLHAVVLGRSNIVGKPMAQLLLRENCTVTIVHSRSMDVRDLCVTADILVAAIGRPNLVRGTWLKHGVTVIDVGINRIPLPEGKTRLVGDVAFEEAQGTAAFITPVPGGVGPMTIAMLLRNTVTAARRATGL
jgi:methylenetetrahydrofolate dehydrogenase (NADP+)/methenyltetrahydrofolate cyclohydrolase